MNHCAGEFRPERAGQKVGSCKAYQDSDQDQQSYSGEEQPILLPGALWVLSLRNRRCCHADAPLNQQSLKVAVVAHTKRRFSVTNSVSGDLPAGDSKKTTCRFRTGVYFSRGHVPPLPNPNHSATALHSVLHTGGEEPSGSFGDPPNSCPRKPDDRIRIWGPFQVLLLGVT